MRQRDMRKGVRVKHTLLAIHLPGYPARGVIVGKPQRADMIRVRRDGMSPRSVDTYWEGFWTRAEESR